MIERTMTSKKNRQYNGYKIKDEWTYSDLQNKTKDRATRTPVKTVCELRCSGRVSSSSSSSDRSRVTV